MAVCTNVNHAAVLQICTTVDPGALVISIQEIGLKYSHSKTSEVMRAGTPPYPPSSRLLGCTDKEGSGAFPKWCMGRPLPLEIRQNIWPFVRVRPSRIIKHRHGRYRGSNGLSEVLGGCGGHAKKGSALDQGLECRNSRHGRPQQGRLDEA